MVRRFDRYQALAIGAGKTEVVVGAGDDTYAGALGQQILNRVFVQQPLPYSVWQL